MFHRYAIRSGYGLPLDAALDIEPRDPSHCLSGLSGILSKTATGYIGYYDDDDRSNPICFEMHSVKHIQQSLSGQEPIPFRTIFLLFLGYIQMPNGERLIVYIPRQTSERYRSRVSGWRRLLESDFESTILSMPRLHEYICVYFGVWIQRDGYQDS